MVPGIHIGTPVHFVPPAGQGYRQKRRCMAAIITKIWSDPLHDSVQLTVFPDGTNDFGAGQGIATSLVRWETSVLHSPMSEGGIDAAPPRTWHLATPFCEDH